MEAIVYIEVNLAIKLKSFDSIVELILLYGLEMSGFENTIDIERIHLQFCKNILHLRKSTPNYMVYGELGRFPLSINKGRSPSNGYAIFGNKGRSPCNDFSFYIDSQISVHQKFKK